MVIAAVTNAQMSIMLHCLSLEVGCLSALQLRSYGRKAKGGGQERTGEGFDKEVVVQVANS